MENAHMRSFLGRKTSLTFLAAMSVVSVAAVAAYAVLPPRDVPPSSVPHGTLATNSLDVLSVAAFTRAINQAHGTNAVLQHLVFTPGQSTLWHTHPGPNLVLVVSGELTLTHNDCKVTTYTDGQGFATGLDEHLAVAGPDGADFYSLYFLPADATDLRNPPSGQSLPPPKCAS
jgi:quercetin dioxygenase-like cupin family protein